MNKKKKYDLLCVEQHTGIIVNLSIKYWRRLPPEAKVSVGVEDLISSATLRVLQQADRYDRVHAPSMFVWRVTENHLRNEVSRFLQKKRVGLMLYLDEGRLPHGVGGRRSAPGAQTLMSALPVSCNVQRFIEARTTIEAILQMASDPLQNLLAAMLEHRARRADVRDDLVAEAAELSKKVGASINDFRIVFEQV